MASALNGGYVPPSACGVLFDYFDGAMPVQFLGGALSEVPRGGAGNDVSPATQAMTPSLRMRR